MFKKGDYVVYGTSGVCQVEDIISMDAVGASQEQKRLHYVLIPSAQRGGRIFTPVDSRKTLMRSIISEDEAEELIGQIPHIEELMISNEKQREDAYKQCMRSCDCREWIKVIKTLHMRNRRRSAQGKRVTAMDEKYLRMAQEYLYSELEIPLGIPKGQMEQYITDKLGQMD